MLPLTFDQWPPPRKARIVRVITQIKKLVEEVVEQEIGIDITAVRVQGELYRAIAEACQREAAQIAAEVDYLNQRNY
jgi:hypothetical protein